MAGQALGPLNPYQVIGPEQVRIQSPTPLQQRHKPTNAEVAEQVMHSHRVKKLKDSQGAGVVTITDADVAEAGKSKFRVLEAAAGPSLADLNRSMDEMKANLKAGLEEIRMQSTNTRICMYNSQARRPEHQLRPLVVQKAGGPQNLGDVPTMMPGGIFPHVLDDLSNITAPQLVQLRTFFHEDFGIQPGETHAEKVFKFRLFIGC
ncbi:hypothetical protein KFL_009490020 [Klebsormidium nitens]|uniref:Uncharacterized protein n=1 Tax=Klebsormidium nitens TaxID=105231 RepID=A0A1Y1IMW3_KLENI|nr:hypothetical protein KFL_009490020 [Klebsormidium nitens]|eukprot:GAQ92220.1 hypothetical protein KFL_009490020 [Klebsormidium nitens]